MRVQRVQRGRERQLDWLKEKLDTTPAHPLAATGRPSESGQQDEMATLVASKHWPELCCAAPTNKARCWKLVLLTIMALVLGQVFLYYNGSSPSYSPSWAILPFSSLRKAWPHNLLVGPLYTSSSSPASTKSSGRGEGGNHGFFENESKGEAGEINTNLVAVTTVQENVDDSVTGNGTILVHSDDYKSLCPPDPPNLLGRLKVDNNPPSLEEQERTHPELSPGGHYLPKNCSARHKVAIIIPYRDRRSHLTTLVHNLHPFLQRQQIEYNIYVVEQAGNGPFNRGMLINVGVAEALKQYPFDCFILHDADLVPENDCNLYTCSQPPRHMSVAISSFGYRLPYKNNFGGVSAITTAQYKDINGFSNEFWGWGGEDDDLFNRIRNKKLSVSRYSSKVGRYIMLPHKKENPSKDRFRNLRTGTQRFKTDGLNSIKYQILRTERRRLFTWLLAALPRR